MKNKRILFEVAHPKHFYQFKQLIDKFKLDNQIKIIARDKDILLTLIDNHGYSYEKYGLHGKSIFTKILVTPKIILDYLKVIFLFKPNYIISRSSPYATFLCKILKPKHIVFPDSEVVPIINKFVGPYSHLIISPKNFSLNYGKNHKKVSSFFEMSYLSSKVFKPHEEVLNTIGLEKNEPFFLIRFVSWQANHDFNNFGFGESEKIDIVNYLSKFGKVIVSGEKKLPSALKKFEMNIAPEDIHSLLFFATLYVGDSQTMATEAALLGTPSYRFNSFVGEKDMSNFIVLEKDLGLLKNFSSYKDLISSLKNVKDFVQQKKNWQFLKNDLKLDLIDITKESIEIINAFDNMLESKI